MAKPLRHVTGVKSSKTVSMDLKDYDKSPDGARLAAKQNIEVHADRAGNGDDVYKGKTKEAPYKKQTKVAEEVEIDEAAYSYKAARAGKDIGEKGKNFEKIASKAAERYGSEERGKKVAGAVLAKIRAKHGIKEDSELDEGNKENKEKKKAVVAREPKEKKKSDFDPREFFSAARRGRTNEAACNHTNEGVYCEVHGESTCPSDDKKDYKDKKGRKLLIDKKKIQENIVNEVAPPDPKIEKWVKANKERFVKEYGKKKGMEVLYATAWKRHGQSESGPATNTDYAGPGAAGWTTGRMDVGTL